ncbi:MAG: hypothetical protein Q7S78_00380 [Candidatus Azambacteria bacterium]|nr:hypothetical protein [Candidatus Azambacteria bacterium]
MSTIQEAMENPGKLKTKKPPAVKVIDIVVPSIKKVKLTAKKEDIDQTAADIRGYLAEIPIHMADLVGRMREIQSATLEEWLIRTDEFRKLEDEVLSHLNADGGPLLTAARQAYALAMVETLLADKKAVIETIKGGGKSRLPSLIKAGILEPTKEPKYDIVVKVYGDSYKVIGGRDFALKIAETLSDKASKAAKAAHDKYHDAVAGLKAQTTITVVELLARKPGKFFLEVPDVKDEEKFLPGGTILAESDGKAIQVVTAVGHFSRIMEEIKKAATFISIESLSQERLNLVKRLPEDAFRRIRILHAVLRRGLAAEFASQKPTVLAVPKKILVAADVQPATLH